MAVRPPSLNPAAHLDLYHQTYRSSATAAARVFLLMRGISTYGQAMTDAMDRLGTLSKDDLVETKDVLEWLDGIDRDRSGRPPTG